MNRPQRCFERCFGTHFIAISSFCQIVADMFEHLRENAPIMLSSVSTVRINMDPDQNE